jgi:hypothetical protein
MNQTVEQVLRTALQDRPELDWEEVLPLVEIAINNANLFDSKYSSFYLNFGFNPSFFADVFEQVQDGLHEPSKRFLERLQTDFENFTTILRNQQKSMKAQADTHRQTCTFKVGDRVYVRTALREQIGHAHYPKLLERNSGPFTITRQINPTTFELDMPVQSNQSNRLHSSFLIPCRESQTQDLRSFRNKSDVKLHPSVFQEACERLKFEPNVDLFANARHHQLPKYGSSNYDPQAYCHDAFSITWRGLRPYLNPPWEIIDKVLDKIIEDQVECLMLIPYWESAHWFRKWNFLATRKWLVQSPLYLDEKENIRPKPRWHSCFAILDGKRIPRL